MAYMLVIVYECNTYKKKKSVDKTIQFCEKKKTSEKIRLQKNKVYAWKEDEKNITIQSSRWDFVYSLLK